MKILGINGIRNNGAENTDRMLARLRSMGCRVCDTSYQLTRFVLQARSRKRQLDDARQLMRVYYEEGDAVVAHSRGCLVNMRMMELGAKFSNVFWFRPAMNRDFYIPAKGCDRLFVIHSPDDRAIRLGEMLWYHDFGAAGRLGLYAGIKGNSMHDPRVANIRAPAYKRHEFWHHSDDFLPENIDHWARTIHACNCKVPTTCDE